MHPLLRFVSAILYVHSTNASPPTGSSFHAAPHRRGLALISWSTVHHSNRKSDSIYVASTEKGVCKVSVPRQTKRDFFRWLRENFDDNEVMDNKSRNKEVIDQLTRYFNGKLAKFTVCGRHARHAVPAPRVEGAVAHSRTARRSATSNSRSASARAAASRRSAARMRATPCRSSSRVTACSVPTVHLSAMRAG